MSPSSLLPMACTKATMLFVEQPLEKPVGLLTGLDSLMVADPSHATPPCASMKILSMTILLGLHANSRLENLVVLPGKFC